MIADGRSSILSVTVFSFQRVVVTPPIKNNYLNKLPRFHFCVWLF